MVSILVALSPLSRRRRQRGPEEFSQYLGVLPFDSEYLLENCGLMATFGVFHVQSVVPEFLYWYDGMLEVWEKLHRGLPEASTQQEDIQEPDGQRGWEGYVSARSGDRTLTFVVRSSDLQIRVSLHVACDRNLRSLKSTLSLVPSLLLPAFPPPPVSSTPLFSFSCAPIRTDAPLS